MTTDTSSKICIGNGLLARRHKIIVWGKIELSSTLNEIEISFDYETQTIFFKAVFLVGYI